MIERNTVLVLGAGASKPYGLPLGFELRRNILNMRLADFHDVDFYSGDLGPDRFFDRFKSAFQEAGDLSIDAFLGANPDFMEIGKLAIAACLLPKEHLGELFPIDLPADHWYGYLAERLPSDPENLIDQNIAFVTFNYDRSLEAYFLTRWKNRHGLPEERAWELVRQLRIVHVYGQLGTLGVVPHQREDCVPYGGGRNLGRSIGIAARGLKLIDDERHDESLEFLTARTWIAEAEVLGFLGFAFDKTNVNRLGGAAIDASRFMTGAAWPPRFAASALGSTERERQSRYMAISAEGGRQIPEGYFFNKESLATLRESQILGY